MKNLLMIAAWWIAGTVACTAQTLPVELMVGHQRTGVDVLWFKKFAAGKDNPWLFFHRSRASVDYHNKTAFDITNAVSYNFRSGIGLVAATQFLQAGFVAKAGMQYFKARGNASVFSWLVAGNNTNHRFSGDWFVLARWSPRLHDAWKGFIQAELFSQAEEGWNLALTQRVRIGIGTDQWQFGFAADFTEAGKSNFSTTRNLGGFLRRVF
ncbi:MAG: hypothetical protein J0L54_03990 [Chitinophagales bacterium]|nr:hypothetical protein [Chitinophagales bacterium]